MSDVLALKYRPKTFDEIIGQDLTINQLKSAVDNDTLGHALLFCGTRGTGKTTTARIIARELNRGFDIVNKWEQQSHLVVTEIDAASNTGVDNVRELIESIRYSTQGHRVILIDECFPWATPIMLSDGRKMPIGKIVTQKLPVEVMSYNTETGVVESKKITNWIKKKAREREMVRIYFSHKNSFSCTPEHKVYTPRGMVKACDIKPKDFILTKTPLSIVQQNALLGTILGNGHLASSISKENARLSVKHSTKQQKYVEFKYEIFKNIVNSPPKVIRNDGYGDGLCTFSTRSDLFLQKIYPRFYNEEKQKVISRETFIDFNDISLAFLYMDDGSLGENSVQISTDNFSEEDNFKIACFLNESFGLKFKVYPNRNKGTFFLSASKADNLDKFFSIISPYIHPSMYYKLPQNYRDKFIGMSFFTEKPQEVFEAEVTKVTNIKYKKTAVYDLTVEDNHNYFVNNGFLVSNCHMLSKSAFNALLKTLEEPPPKVTFILLTTEIHRLPDTVKSRCQIYEFHEVSMSVLKDYYETLMSKEGVNVDVAPAALRAEGSVRDGLSILQKALSGEQELDNSKQYFELMGSIYSQDVTTALHQVSELKKLEESRVIIQTLEKWVYWCSMESFGQRTPIREFFEGNNDLNFDLLRLQYLFDTCIEIEKNLVFTPNSKITLDMGILKLCL